MVTIKDVCVQLPSTLHIHAHVNYIFSQSLKALWLITTVNYSFLALTAY